MCLWKYQVIILWCACVVAAVSLSVSIPGDGRDVVNAMRQKIVENFQKRMLLRPIFDGIGRSKCPKQHGGLFICCFIMMQKND